MIFGGNPFSRRVWAVWPRRHLFHQGYKFFMIAIGDQEK